VFTVGYLYSEVYAPTRFVLDRLLLTQNNKDIYYTHIFFQQNALEIDKYLNCIVSQDIMPYLFQLE